MQTVQVLCQMLAYIDNIIIVFAGSSLPRNSPTSAYTGKRFRGLIAPIASLQATDCFYVLARYWLGLMPFSLVKK